MVVNCVAFGCKNVYSKDPNISFHTFPFKREEILKLWIKEIQIRRENWKPARRSTLCSKHFKESDYQVKPGSSVKLLKPTAVPSIFNFPEHLLKKSLEPRRTLTYNEDVSTKECASTSTAIKEKKGDDQQRMEVVPLLQDKWTQTNISQRRFNIMRRKIKSLKQKVRRKEQVINNAKSLIRELKKNQINQINVTIEQ